MEGGRRSHVYLVWVQGGQQDPERWGSLLFASGGYLGPILLTDPSKRMAHFSTSEMSVRLEMDRWSSGDNCRSVACGAGKGAPMGLYRAKELSDFVVVLAF